VRFRKFALKQAEKIACDAESKRCTLLAKA
jgi:hypothetical protein